jgi:hypothetical protein
VVGAVDIGGGGGGVGEIGKVGFRWCHGTKGNLEGESGEGEGNSGIWGFSGVTVPGEIGGTFWGLGTLGLVWSDRFESGR